MNSICNFYDDKYGILDAASLIYYSDVHLQQSSRKYTLSLYICTIISVHCTICTSYISILVAIIDDSFQLSHWRGYN